jgi:RNA-directed DNA polymerase
MKGRTSQEPTDPVEGERPVKASRPGHASTRHGGKHGEVQEDPWMKRVLDPENLAAAWKRVKANGGAPGIDAMSVGDFPAFARRHWERIRVELSKGSYRPAAVRRVFIPKPDGTQRPLGVPTVLDRVIQQAIAQVLTPLYDGEFSEDSYGFRAGRNAHQAVRRMEGAWTEGRRHAVDCDLKAFFDTVQHDRLQTRLREKICGGLLLRLIGRYLRAGVVLPDGSREETPQGVPQGGPLSPLLANIVLDPLDKELERRGHCFARYADDFLVMVRSARAARRVMESLRGFIEGTLQLVVNQTKSQTAPLKRCAFLGFQIGAKGKVVWTAKVLKRFKERVKEITRRNRGHHVSEVIDELKRYVLGWMNYFGISHTYKEVVEPDKWLRRRVRLYYWKQWKQPRTRRRRLIALGIPPEEVKLASRSRKGYWRMSGNSIVQRALTKQWLKEQGVPELRSQWIELHYGPGADAKSTV